MLILLYSVFRLDALALSVIISTFIVVVATATWLAGWVAGCPSQPVLYQND